MPKATHASEATNRSASAEIPNDPASQKDEPPGEATYLLNRVPLDPSYLLTLPCPDAEGLEGLLGQANQRRLIDSLGRLEQVIPKLADWLTRTPNSTVALSTPESPRDSAQSLPHRLIFTEDELWGVVDRAMHYDDARPGRLTIDVEAAAAGVDADLQFDNTYEIHRPNIGRLAKKLAQGATMVLRSIARHAQSLDALAADLETLLGTAVEIDAIAFGSGSTHLDRGDRGGHILVLPFGTNLRAEVLPTLAQSDQLTADTQGRSISTKPMAAVPGGSSTIGVGNVILARADQNLRVESESLGIALRIVLPVVSESTLRQHGAAMARYHPLLRADLPTDLTAPINSYAGTLYEDPGAFHREASSALGPIARGHASASCRSVVPPRPTNPLSTALSVGKGRLPWLRAPLPGGLLLTHLAGQEAIVAAGLVFTFEHELLAVLAPLLDGRAFDPAPILAPIEAALPYETEPSISREQISSDQPGEPALVPARSTLELFRALLTAEILEVAP